MTIHLMTVGTTVRKHLVDTVRPESLIHVSSEGTTVLRDADRLGVDRALPDSAADLLRRLSEGDAGTRQAALRVIRDAEVSTWSHDAFAESTAFTLRTRQPYLTHDDLVVLLATDTVDGLLSAFWVTARLLGVSGVDGFDALDFLDDLPAERVDDLARRARGQVLVVRLRGLRMAEGTAGPSEAMRALGLAGRLVLRSLASDENVVVHLSGGYKVTLPFLLGTAEGLHSMLSTDDADRVCAFIVHEDALGRDVRVPLRRLDLDHARKELGCFDTGYSSSEPPHGALAGYAYEVGRQGGRHRWRLTPYGQGLRTLVGMPPAVIGP
jgi:hypothetical protein